MKATCQVIAEGGSAPSSVGLSIVAVGKRLFVTVRVATLELTSPDALRTTTEKIRLVIGGGGTWERVARRIGAGNVHAVALPLVSGGAIGGNRKRYRVAHENGLVLQILRDARQLRVGKTDLAERSPRGRRVRILIARQIVKAAVRRDREIDRAVDAADEAVRRCGIGGIDVLDSAVAEIGKQVHADKLRRELRARRIVKRAAGDRAASTVWIDMDGVRKTRIGGIAFCRRPAVVGAGNAAIDFFKTARAHIVDEDDPGVRLDIERKRIAQAEIEIGRGRRLAY